MSFDSYPLRMVLAIAITIGGIFLIAAIFARAPNFIVGMLILIPIVPLLRLVGDIANPDVDVPFRPRVLLQYYLQVLFILVLMLGAIALVIPVVAVGLGMLAAALAILVAVVGLALWAFQFGFGITLARTLEYEELFGLLLLLGAGIGGGALALGLMYLGTLIKDRADKPFWRAVDRVRMRIDALAKD
jgi:hypothetical protein